MRINLLLAFLLHSILISTNAQEIQNHFKLNGSVVDSAMGFGLENVNILFLSRTDSSMITGTSTDSTGNFTAENINAENVRIKFSMVGYQTKIIDSVSLKSISNIGQVKLKATGIMLPEVVVKTVKPMIEIKIDKQIINVDQVPGNSGSLTDVLKNTGVVQVDPATNNISVRGQSVKLQMDGHQFDMPQDMLAQMPAKMFDQVEVILSPSAKESAEGGAYILNLISKKTDFDNFNGSINLNTSTNSRHYGGINFNYKKNKLNLFSSVFGGLMDFRSFYESDQINYNSTSLYQQHANGESKNTGNFAYVKAGLDYNFDENNLITFYGTINNFSFDPKMVSTNSIKNNLGTHLYSYTNNNTSKYDYRSYSLYSYYKKKLDDKGKEISLDAMFSDINSPSNSDMNVLYSYSSLPAQHKGDTKEDAKTFIFKGELVFPTEEYGKFETGYNFTYRNRSNDYKALDYSYSTNSWADSLSLSNFFRYNENINALYFTYSNNFDKIELSTGLRVENLYTHGEQITSSEDFSNNFFNLFPNLNVGYKFNDLFQLSFNAFRRVVYPTLYYVNPFKTYSGPNSYRLGNAQIKPYFLNSFAVKLSQYINVYYVYSNGMFDNATSIIDDSVSVSSPINIGSNKTYGLELTLPYYNSPMMPFHLPDFINMINIQFGYNYRKQTGQYLNENLNYNGNRTWLTANIGLAIWYDINSNISLRYNPKSTSGRYVNESTAYLSLYLSKNFFDRKLQLSIAFMDLLDSQKRTNETYGTDFYSKSTFSSYRSRSVSFGISYRINDYKDRRDENIDDGRDANNNATGF